MTNVQFKIKDGKWRNENLGRNADGEPYKILCVLVPNMVYNSELNTFVSNCSYSENCFTTDEVGAMILKLHSTLCINSSACNAKINRDFDKMMKGVNLIIGRNNTPEFHNNILNYPPTGIRNLIDKEVEKDEKKKEEELKNKNKKEEQKTL